MAEINAPLRREGSGGPPATQGAQPAPPAAVPERPQLAPGVQLVGEMPETGFAERQWLIMRDGRFLQISELLYRVAEHADGERTLEQIAERVTACTEWAVQEEHVRQLIQSRLMPLGLIVGDDPGPPPPPAGEPALSAPLSVRMRKRVIGPEIIEPVAAALQFLYRPAILLPMLAAIAAAHIWLYTGPGVMAGVLDVLYRPWALVVVLGLMVLAGAFHEFGHAAALRYGGGKVRGMGVGLYLIYPAFYTDVTDSYRLGRWARVRTDLGGFYFYLIFALGMIGLYLATGYEFLLFIVLLINFDILYQMLPFVRFDGYWALADLTGIPDFFSQIGPFLASILPLPGYTGQRLPPLKPWVRLVFIAYIALTIPVLALLTLFAMQRLPVFLVATWDSVLNQLKWLSIAQSAGSPAAMSVVGVNLLLLLLLALGSILFFGIVVRSVALALWGWGRTSPARGLMSGAVALVLIALIVGLWAPHIRAMSTGVPEGVQTYEVTQRAHVETPVAYAQHPPVGGDHAPVWQNCGFYAAPVASEHAVHSMEHGAVWITYRPDLPPAQVDQLRQRAEGQPYVLVSPIADLPAPVVASAWGRQLMLDSADDPRLDQFVRAFRLGEAAPERGGPCTGGVGAAGAGGLNTAEGAHP